MVNGPKCGLYDVMSVCWRCLTESWRCSKFWSAFYLLSPSVKYFSMVVPVTDNWILPHTVKGNPLGGPCRVTVGTARVVARHHF